MSQPEARISRQIQEAIRARQWFCFKVHGSEFMMAGLPDIIACAEGLFIGLETKRSSTRGDVSPRQRYVHQQIRNAHGVVHVVCSAAEAIAVIEQALRDAGIDP